MSKAGALADARGSERGRRHAPALPAGRPLHTAFLILLGVFFAALPFVAGPDGFEKFRVPKDIFIVLAVSLLAPAFLLFARIQSPFRPGLWEWSMAAGLIYVAAHGALTGRPAVSLPPLVPLLCFAGLLVVLVAVLTEEATWRLWIAVATATGVNAILTLLQYYGHFPLMTTPAGQVMRGRLNPAGLIGDVNSGGFLFGLTCLILLYGIFAERNRTIKVAAGALFALNLTGLVYTRTLTAMFALALCLGLWLLFHHWWVLRTQPKAARALVLLWVGLLLCGAGSVALASQAGLGERVRLVYGQVRGGNWMEATSGRQPVFRIVWEMIKEKPWLGRGLNTFGRDFFFYRANTPVGKSVVLLDQPGSFREVHNDYLQAWEELGVVGLVLFLILVLGPILGTAPLLLRTRDPRRLYWLGTLSIGMLFVALTAASFFPFHLSVTGACIVLLLAGLRQAAAPRLFRLETGTRLSLWRVAASGVLFLCLAWPQVQKWRANNQMEAAGSLLESALGRQFQPWQQQRLAQAALDKLQQAEALHAGFEEIYNLQGTALVLIGKPEEALRTYSKAASLVPSPEVFTNMAAAYLTLKDFNQAQSLIEMVLRYNPDFPRAQEAMEYISKNRR